MRGRGRWGAAAWLAAVAGVGVLIGGAGGRAWAMSPCVNDRVPEPTGPGMPQPGNFPLEPGGPAVVSVRPTCWMLPVYLADGLVGALGVAKGARGAWPGVRWQTAAALLGAANLLGGGAALFSLTRGEVEGLTDDERKDWTRHAVIATFAGAALLGTAIVAAAATRRGPADDSDDAAGARAATVGRSIVAAPVLLPGGAGVTLRLAF
jgi:hypothetical protein